MSPTLKLQLQAPAISVSPVSPEIHPLVSPKDREGINESVDNEAIEAARRTLKNILAEIEEVAMMFVMF